MSRVCGRVAAFGRKPAVAALGALLCVGGLVGCSDGPPLRDGAIAAPSEKSALVLLDEAMGGGYDGNELVRDASLLLAERCMAEEGFGGFTPPGGGGITGDFDAWRAVELDYWWGVSQAKYGAEFGYRPLPMKDFLTVTTNTGPPVPAGYQEAYSGSDGLSGCIGEAAAQINEGIPATVEELNVISGEVEAAIDQATRASTGIQDASDRWSECMANEGYVFANPHEAFAEYVSFPDGVFAGVYVSPSPSEDEKRQAEIDGGCKEETGFWAARDAAEAAAKESVAVSMRTEAETVAEAHAIMVKNATETLESN